MKFILKTYNLNTTDDELLEDLKKTAKGLRKKKLTTDEYNACGKFSSSTLINRFGSWNNTLLKAGLEINRVHSLTQPELFENLKKVWTTLKRQPLLKEMVKPLSAYSYSAYYNKFGTWRAALISFVKQQEKRTGLNPGKKVNQNKGPKAKVNSGKNQLKEIKRRKNKHVSKSIRYDILKRDKYKCRACGSSPATNPKVILHVDHIIPYSKGGKTVPRNLQTLCSDCNYGKGTKTNRN